MKKRSEFVSLDALPDDYSLWLAGAVFDPVFEAVAGNEEEGDDSYAGASVLDWDGFMVVHATHKAERNAVDRHERAVLRGGKPPKKGGRDRELPDFKCLWCGTFFRPQSAKKKLCSPVCARRYTSKHSKYGAMMDRIEAATGMRRALIAQRLVRGWTEARCILQGIQKKSAR